MLTQIVNKPKQIACPMLIGCGRARATSEACPMSRTYLCRWIQHSSSNSNGDMLRWKTSKDGIVFNYLKYSTISI